MSYHYLEHGADQAFEVTAESKEALFMEAGHALFSLMAELDTVKAKNRFTIELQEEDLESLFYEWLSELLSLADLNNILFSDFAVEKITSIDDNVIELEATASGESIDPNRHGLQSEVKAITYQGLRVCQENGVWKARCVVDV